MNTWCSCHGPRAGGDMAPCQTPPAYVTHEQYIHAVRDIILPRVPNPVSRERLATAKLVYGAGAGTGARGVTYYRTWKNGHSEPIETVEVCAFGEEHPIQLAGTTIHEMAHVLAGHSAGHGKEWKDACNDLGLIQAEAAGQSYTWRAFDPFVRDRIMALAPPSDGTPVSMTADPLSGLLPVVPGRRRGHGPRPCSAGIGTRGGKSRGQGSGSRLRLWLCACPVRVRVASDAFNATCGQCEQAFKRG